MRNSSSYVNSPVPKNPNRVSNIGLKTKETSVVANEGLIFLVDVRCYHNFNDRVFLELETSCYCWYARYCK